MLSALRRSVALLVAHPVLALALGTAIVLSICATCIGVGLLAAPWFVCELLAMQLAASGRTVAPRGRTWLSASVVVLVMLAVAMAAGWLAMLGFGPGEWDQSDDPLPWPETFARVGSVVGACTLTVLFLAPFIHAPSILLDRGGRIGGAMMESAMLVRTTGLLRHLVIATCAQVLALTPPVVAGMVVAREFARAATPIGFLLALPAMPVSIALGLGLLTVTYLDTERSLGDARRAQRLESLPPLHRWTLAALLAAPLLGLLLLGASALGPTPPIEGPVAMTGSPTVIRAGEERAIEETSLTVRTTDREVEVRAGMDPALHVPRAWPGPIDEVVVGMTAQGDYAIEVRAGGRAWHVLCDRAGERSDDSVRASLLSHASGWMLAAFVLSAAIVALFSIRAFAPLGAARAHAARRLGIRTVDAEAQRQSYRVAVALLPFALTALLSGALAFVRA